MKEENKDQKSFVDLSNAREPEQIKVMEEIAAGGYCPFCPEHFLKNHKKPIIKETEHWMLTENQWPYDHTSLHLMVVLKYHEEDFQNLSPQAAHEYMDLMQWAAKEYKMEGGMFGMRTGKSELSSSTVTHLHGQLVVPNPETIGPNESVVFYIGKPKSQKGIETIGDFFPLEHRIVDNQYKNLLKKIWTQGEETKPIHGEKVKQISGALLSYDIRNGVPLCTERDLTIGWKGGLREHEAFRNGAVTLEDLRKFKVPDIVWEPTLTKENCERWGLPEGHMGLGAYGEAFARFPAPDGKVFNQFRALEEQMKKMPMLRTHMVTPFIPYYLIQGDEEFPRRTVVAPCHGMIFIQTNVIKKTFTLSHIQRSGDVPVGVVYNLLQYTEVGMMLQRVTKLKFTRLNYFIHDAHIYERQYPFIESLINQPARKLPIMNISREDANSIFDYTADDFSIAEYDHGPKQNIPTPV